MAGPFRTYRRDCQVRLYDQGVFTRNQTDLLVRAVLTACARLNERTEGSTSLPQASLPQAGTR